MSHSYLDKNKNKANVFQTVRIHGNKAKTVKKNKQLYHQNKEKSSQHIYCNDLICVHNFAMINELLF